MRSMRPKLKLILNDLSTRLHQLIPRNHQNTILTNKLTNELAAVLCSLKAYEKYLGGFGVSINFLGADLQYLMKRFIFSLFTFKQYLLLLGIWNYLV